MCLMMITFCTQNINFSFTCGSMGTYSELDYSSLLPQENLIMNTTCTHAPVLCVRLINSLTHAPVCSCIVHTGNWVKISHVQPRLYIMSKVWNPSFAQKTPGPAKVLKQCELHCVHYINPNLKSCLSTYRSCQGHVQSYWDKENQGGH